MEKKILVLTLIAWMMSISSVFASENYVVGVGDYAYYPHHTYSDNEYSGFARDILDLFAQKHDITFDYRALPWKRVVKEFVEGGLDFVFPDNSQWDTDKKKGKQVHYSDPVVQYIDGVMVLPENQGRGIKQLKRLGTIRGFTAWPYYDHTKSGRIELMENSNFIPLLKQVLSQRVDGAYVEISVAKYNLRENINQPGALVFDPSLPHTKDYYHLSSIKHAKIIKAFNAFLIAEKEALDQLKKKYKLGPYRAAP